MHVKEVSLAPTLPPSKPWDTPDVCVDPLACCVLAAGSAVAAFSERRSNPLTMGHTVTVCSMTNKGNSRQGLNAELKDAVKANDKKNARELIAKGANPFSETTEGDAAFFRAKDMEMVLILTRMEGVVEFADCLTIHDFCYVLFPQVTKVLDNYKMPRWMPNVPFFDCEHSLNLYVGRFEIAEDLEDRLPEPTIENILRLLKTAPFFRILWDKAGAPRIEEVPDETYFAASYARGKGALYNSESNVILIDKRTPLKRKISHLIFELLNAAQRKRAQEVFHQAEAGNLAREEFTLLLERIEFDTNLWHTKILNLFGFEATSYKKFSDYWAATQVPFVKHGISHADAYRRRWDKNYLSPYLNKNPLHS
jgi:hypothetical protein